MKPPSTSEAGSNASIPPAPRRITTTVNDTTSQAETDLGGGAVFYDNAVEVEVVRGPEHAVEVEVVRGPEHAQRAKHAVEVVRGPEHAVEVDAARVEAEAPAR